MDKSAGSSDDKIKKELVSEKSLNILESDVLIDNDKDETKILEIVENEEVSHVYTEEDNIIASTSKLLLPNALSN